ncbi:MAG: hypothetical protein UX12_C0002G0011 [Candidatus Collierbacteria bacterium GW2011_GWC1_45_47]|uniref:Major facilitator superfamily (MFS) profile domain-containing protein n=6 Tax=Candidatus Collieribacteriota TaxID=1752725 RepID=A0A0G1HJG1_9BACT|nr:MAG: hypothetical protein UW23_C0011G0011 [Candidatus Collierbacteria bacterium GW2011_GWA1_44_12]KKT39546.1 MAG: hypothetical protein UW26_C0001G0033 [Candidatus Collierbacteria bacterium GW2011_GWF1_44_12]KKT47075.1 MAG: hypothetical protein UW35_C0003G0012 [Candidatus Collierbacteria bacterium GW2011_GWF2_44_15]KKT68049.1 MAG: hypothetical protein UW62_C0006G0008 [Candidatus Collierbacteria bacterium GW2011_GWB1_44_35]KKT99110.1 MAG: hypothetical protein UW99_C0009G0004 [Candidatus Collie
MKINKALKVLITYNGLLVFGVMLFGPLYAVFVQNIGGGVLLISISSAVFYLSSALFLWVVGKMGDKVKEKELMLAASYLIKAIGYLGFLIINSALGLILLQMLFGLAEALGSPTFGALFAKHVDGDMEVMEYADWALIASLIMAVGALIGGYVVTTLGFGLLFVVISALCFIAFLGIILTPRKLL